MDQDEIVDISILGAGPVGLAAAYYAGHRGASVRIIEALEQLGGQIAATYPEKYVYDVAGHPRVLGQDLVDLCVEQGLQWGAKVHLGEEVCTLEQVTTDGEELLVIETAAGAHYRSRALIVTAGHGAFEPRKLAIEGIDDWRGRGLHYFVREKEAFRGQRCVIVGGGDSALDWTLGLADTAAAPLALVHRRDRFRAAESLVATARKLEAAGMARIMTPYEVSAIHGNERIEAVTVANIRDGASELIPCEALITLLGFVSHLGPIADWGLELEGRRQLKVDPTTMATSVAGVYAAGDVAGYEGKITLITVGFGEAAIATNNAVARIRGERVQPKYSTD